MIKACKRKSELWKKGLSKISVYMVIGILSGIILPELALAAKFDINEGVKAATTPIIGALKEHWGKGVLITGILAALIGEGDARQRSVRAGVMAASAGCVILALIAMFT